MAHGRSQKQAHVLQEHSGTCSHCTKVEHVECVAARVWRWVGLWDSAQAHTHVRTEGERESRESARKRDVWVYACLSTELQQSFAVHSAWQARQESVQSPDVQNRKTRPNKYVHSLVDTGRSAGVGALLKRSHGSAWQRTLGV